MKFKLAFVWVLGWSIACAWALHWFIGDGFIQWHISLTYVCVWLGGSFAPMLWLDE